MEVAAAIIGALAGLLAGYLAGRQASRLEYEKETRHAAAQVARGIGAAIHTISWLTWRAKSQPQHLRVKHVDAFDRDMHLLYPELTGSLALVAALNKNVYDRLRKVVDKVYALDVRVAESTTSVRDGAEGAAALVAAHHGEAQALERSLKEDLKDLMTFVSGVGDAKPTGSAANPGAQAAPEFALTAMGFKVLCFRAPCGGRRMGAA